MRTAAMLACAGAVLAAPVPTYADLRLRGLQSGGGVSPRGSKPVGWAASPMLRRPRRFTALSAGVGAVLPVVATLASGGSHAVAVPALAGAVAGAVAGRLVGMAAATRTESRLCDSLTSRIAAVAAEIRAGQSEAAAFHSAAAGAEPELARLLVAAGDAAAAGGDVAGCLQGDVEAAELPMSVRAGVRRLAAAWATSRDCGAAIAGILDRVHEDLSAHRRRAQQVSAHLAGARATAVLLSFLPALGILLGSAAGTHPVHVLLATPLGQVALFAGVTLDAAGVLWTARITRSAGRSP